MAQRNLDTMTMAELAEEAHRVGIQNVEHMSTEELREAIEQQKETNAVQPPLREDEEYNERGESSMPPGWENFPG
ncbi:Rho termination factor [Qaidamihabitans albus]|uniref:Rho termination factor n=1 Tax=Qaidamihabitans albus TaxID=2795733 RepID=UPI0018F19438|nr:Rho termination factor [Qaidamihabitans albus]